MAGGWTVPTGTDDDDSGAPSPDAARLASEGRSAARRAEDLRASLAGHREAQSALAEAAAVRRQATQDAEALLTQAQALATEVVAEARTAADLLTARAELDSAGVVDGARSAAGDLIAAAEQDAAALRERAEAEVAAHLRAELAAADEQSRAVLAIAADRARRVHDELDRATRTVAALLADQRAGAGADLADADAELGVDLEIDTGEQSPGWPRGPGVSPSTTQLPPPYVGPDPRPLSELSVTELAQFHDRSDALPAEDVVARAEVPRTQAARAEVPQAGWPPAHAPIEDPDDPPLAAPTRPVPRPGRVEPQPAPTRPLGWLFRSNT